MAYGRRWKPSKSQAKKFAQEMNEIDTFCDENAISHSKSSDSYYFTIKGQRYRVSNHTVQASDKGMYNFLGEKVRDSYHDNDMDNVICITAGKTRIRGIYESLEKGEVLDKRGYPTISKVSLSKETMTKKQEQAKAHNESVKSAPAKDKGELEV